MSEHERLKVIHLFTQLSDVISLCVENNTIFTQLLDITTLLQYLPEHTPLILQGAGSKRGKCWWLKTPSGVMVTRTCAVEFWDVNCGSVGDFPLLRTSFRFNAFPRLNVVSGPYLYPICILSFWASICWHQKIWRQGTRCHPNGNTRAYISPLPFFLSWEPLPPPRCTRSKRLYALLYSMSYVLEMLFARRFLVFAHFSLAFSVILW